MVRSHLEKCPACREELAGLEAVIMNLKAAPRPEPDQAFWDNFNRELHLKLAQSVQSAPSVPEPPPARSFKIPYYLLGAPALAGLLLWVAFGYLNPERPGLPPQPQLSQEQKALEKTPAAPRLAAPVPVPAPEKSEAVVMVSQNGHDMHGEDDLDLDGDLDSTLAGMTETEREAFLKKVRQHEKDGSCTRKSLAVSWA
jgi:anti-sigma factor RsiW